MNNFLTSDTDRKWFKSVLQHLEDYFESLETRYDKLKKEFNELYEEKWANETLQKMEEELEKVKDEMYRGFPISKEDNDKINNWILNHDKEKHNNPKHYYGVSGGGYEYSFIPTGLGTIGYCICSACKHKALISSGKNYWAELKKNDGYIEFGDFG